MAWLLMLSVAMPSNAIVLGCGYGRLSQVVRARCWQNLVGASLTAAMGYFFVGVLLDLDLGGQPRAA